MNRQLRARRPNRPRLELLESGIRAGINHVVTRARTNADGGLGGELVVDPIQRGPAPVVAEAVGQPRVHRARQFNGQLRLVVVDAGCRQQVRALGDLLACFDLRLLCHAASVAEIEQPLLAWNVAAQRQIV